MSDAPFSKPRRSSRWSRSRSMVSSASPRPQQSASSLPSAVARGSLMGTPGRLSYNRPPMRARPPRSCCRSRRLPAGLAPDRGHDPDGPRHEVRLSLRPSPLRRLTRLRSRSTSIGCFTRRQSACSPPARSRRPGSEGVAGRVPRARQEVSDLEGKVEAARSTCAAPAGSGTTRPPEGKRPTPKCSSCAHSCAGTASRSRLRASGSRSRGRGVARRRARRLAPAPDSRALNHSRQRARNSAVRAGSPREAACAPARRSASGRDPPRVPRGLAAG